MRATSTLLLLCIILGGLMVVTWFDAEERVDAVPPLLFGFDQASDVAGLDIKNKSGTIILRRKDEGWRLIEPRAYANTRIDSAAVDATLVGLIALRSTPVTPFGGEHDFGFDNASPRLSLLGREGHRVTIILGGVSGFSGDVFVRRQGTQVIGHTDGSIKYHGAKGLHHLRDRRIVRFHSNAIVGITLLNKGNPRPLILKKKNDSWRFAKSHSIKTGVDPDVMQRLLNQLTGLRARRFIIMMTDQAASTRSQHAALKARAKRTVVLTSENMKTQTLYFDKDPGTTTWIALMIDDAADIGNMQWGDWTPASFKDTRIVLFDIDAIVSIRIKTPMQTFTLDQDGTAWRFRRGRSPASRAEILAVLYHLSTLRGREVVVQPPLGPVLYSVTLSDSGNRSRVLIQIFKAEHPKGYYVKGSTGLFYITQEALGGLNLRYADFEP